MTSQRVVIVDDEPHARTGLRLLVSAHDGFEVAGEAADGDSALTVIASTRPDLVLLDVQMPGTNGLSVAAALAGRDDAPLIVFITAYDQHAVQAFELSATDYIVKPFTDARFAQMMERVRQTLELRRTGELGARLIELAGAAGLIREPAEQPASPRYLDRIVYREDGTTHAIPLQDVAWIEAASYYARIHLVGGRSFLLRESLNSLAGRLDPSMFMRVHRSALIRPADVTTIVDDDEGLRAVLMNGVVVKITQGKVKELEARMG